MDTQEAIISRLKEAMKKNRIPSWNALAKVAEVDASGLTKASKGEKTISDRTLKKISKSLHVSFLWLAEGTGSMDDFDPEAFVHQENVNGENQYTERGNFNNHSGVSDTILAKALEEISQLRKLLQEAVQNNTNLTNRLMTLLENIYTK